jgi:hypothetical protein
MSEFNPMYFDGADYNPVTIIFKTRDYCHIAFTS